MKSRKSSDTPFSHDTSSQNNVHLLQAVNEALIYLLQNNDLEQVLTQAFTTICEAIGCDGAYLFDYANIESDKMVTHLFFGLRLEEDQWQQITPRIFESPLETSEVKARLHAMMEQNATTIVLVENTPPQLRELLKNMDVASYLSFSVTIDEKIWGGISFVSRADTIDWAMNKRQPLMPFVSSLSNYIERKKTEQALKEQRDYLEQIINSSPNPIYAKNERGEFTLVNLAMAKLHGKKPAAMVGESIFKFHEDKNAMKEALREDLEILKEGKPRLDMRRALPNPNGELRYLQISKVPIFRKNGSPNEVFTTITDITDIKKIEDNLREERNFSHSITSTIPDWVILVDLENKRFSYSNLTYPLLGYTQSEQTNFFHFLLDKLHPSDVHLSQNFKESLDQIADHEIIEKHFRLQHKDGHWLHFYERARVFSRHPDGRMKEYLAIIQEVTEDLEAKQELAESKQRYKNFIKHSFDGIYYLKFDTPIPLDIPAEDQVEMYYKYGYVAECNAAFAKMYGVEDPTQLIGFRVHDVHKGEHFEHNRLETLSLIKKGYRIADSETREPDQDGNTVYLLNHAIGDIKDGKVHGIWGTQQNITKRRKVEQDLKESKSVLQGIINALPDFKFRINKDGFFKDYYPSENEQEEPLAFPEYFIGKKMADILPPHIVEIGMHAINISLQHRGIEVFEYGLSIEGTLNYYEGRVAPINEEEVILVVRNISDRKYAEEELQKKIKELDLKNQELVQYIESNFQLENFAYIASHDLREPVRTIHNFAQMLQRNYSDLLDEKGKRHLNFIINGADHMNRLILDLLEYAKISSEKIQFEAIDIVKMLHIIMNDIGSIFEEKKAEIYVGNLPEYINADRTRLRQLLQNLLTNAIKFHKPGVAPQISIQAIDDHPYWLFEVKDNGSGIPKEKHEEIFQLFKKLSKDDQYPGTGIGLAICQRIVEHHGGKIWVESEPEVGSAFYFTIKKQ